LASEYGDGFENLSPDKIREQILELKEIEKKCSWKGQDNFLLFYLIAERLLAIHADSCDIYFNKCIRCPPPPLPGLLESICSHKSECGNHSSHPAVRPKFIPNKPSRVSTFAKINQPNSSQYNSALPYLYDTAIYGKTLNDLYGQEFSLYKKDSAKRYYTSKYSKTMLASNLTSDTSKNILLFHNNSLHAKGILKKVERNIEYWGSALSLKSSGKLITGFIIPQRTLNVEEKKAYKLKFGPSFNFLSSSGVQTQNYHKDLQFKLFRRKNVPNYIWKLDFLKFVNFKEKIIPYEGSVGYSDPYDNTFETYEQNYIGAINHEIFHLILFSNFSYCPQWLNEGLASLFEAGRFNRCSKVFIPINNLRIAEFQDTSLHLTSSYFLNNVLNKNWDSTTVLFQRDMAISRYLMFYLSENGKLTTFMDTLMNEVRNTEYVSNAQIVELLLNTCGYSNINELSVGFEKFIKKQLKICIRNGKVKRKYEYGLFKNDIYY
jgi:hypothetical protein